MRMIPRSLVEWAVSHVWRASPPTRRIKNEEGAAVIIVVLSLAAIIGMVVLVVDVGGLLTLRRQMVTTSDSAALAAAQSCALERPAEAQDQADELATANRPDALGTLFETTDCGTGSSGDVKVRYQAPKTLIFAPILGAPETRPVSHTATAIWGPTGGTNPVPIEFSINEAGEIPCVHQPIGSQCNYWHDNNVDHDMESNSHWGFLNLDQWGVTPGAKCNSPGSSRRRDWINGTTLTHVSIVGDYALACVDSGHSSSSWDELEAQVGKIKHFPINDPAHMVMSHPNQKYAIIGFAALRIEAVLKGNDPRAIGAPGDTGNCSGTHSFNLNEHFDLDAMGCYSENPETISNLELSSGKGKNKTVYQSGAHYLFDPISHVVTWFANPTDDVSIDFDYALQGTAGYCGYHPKDPNAICIVASWQGARLGGTNPGTGQDFGLRAVRLDG